MSYPDALSIRFGRGADEAAFELCCHRCHADSVNVCFPSPNESCCKPKNLKLLVYSTWNSIHGENVMLQC